jgi:hypothetical protein
MKIGFRKPSFKKSFAARTSWKRVARHSLGLKAPRGWGWLTNPKKAAYNRVYNRATFGLGAVFRNRGTGGDISAQGAGEFGCVVPVVFALLFGVLAIATSALGAAIIMLVGGGGVMLIVKHYRGRQRELEAATDAAAERTRLSRLSARWGPEIAQMIVQGQYWRKATAEMIIESLGAPANIREQVLKTKTKTTYCYHPLSAKRYALKIHFENGVVVGWDE